MHLEPSPEKPGKFDVTFANEDERIVFGLAAPLWTREHQKASANFYNHGQSMIPYDSEWPQTVTLSKRIVAWAAGDLVATEVKNPGTGPTRTSLIRDIMGSAIMQHTAVVPTEAQPATQA